VLPQVLPRIIGLSIYQWDVHLRHSTIIGIVGAGGIGSTLYNAFQRYDFDFALAILLVIVALVVMGEAVSAVARRRVQ
jgi:phosphonate transport system permease protein